MSKQIEIPVGFKAYITFEGDIPGTPWQRWWVVSIQFGGVQVFEAKYLTEEAALYEGGDPSHVVVTSAEAEEKAFEEFGRALSAVITKEVLFHERA